MQGNQLSNGTLRRLAQIDPGEGKVVSLYLNLDPAEFATQPARISEFRSLLDEGNRLVRQLELTHQEQEQVEYDLRRLEEFLYTTDLKGAHGLAVFCCKTCDTWEVIKLPRSVPSRIFINDTPLLEPLVDIEVEQPWCIALINRRNARIFRGSQDALTQIATVHDFVHSQHHQGGWSQARYQRAIRKEARDHYKHVAEELFEHWKHYPFEHLLIGCPAELLPDIEHALHPYVQARFRGHLEIDVENTILEEVHVASKNWMCTWQKNREVEAFTHLQDGLGQHSGATIGLQSVLDALNERRVGTLLIQENASLPGTVCPECGWLSTNGNRCPVDENDLRKEPDILEEAVNSAIRQSAEVMILHHHDLGLEQVGALLRF